MKVNFLFNFFDLNFTWQPFKNKDLMVIFRINLIHHPENHLVTWNAGL
ncbi:hypothetical protein V462_08165 [Pantoea ananatis 15320]|nr:hypothetical protein V462_08165 [Pantoea ananatis 15320]